MPTNSLPLSLSELAAMQESLKNVQLPEPFCSSLAKLFVQAERAAGLEEAVAGMRVSMEEAADRTSFRVGKIGAEILLMLGDSGGLSVSMNGTAPQCIAEEGLLEIKRRLGVWLTEETRKLREWAKDIQEKANRSRSRSVKKAFKAMTRDLLHKAARVASDRVKGL